MYNPNLYTLSIQGTCSDGSKLDVTYVGLDIFTGEILVFVHEASDADITYREIDINNPRYHFILPSKLIETGSSFAFMRLSKCNVTSVNMEEIEGSQKELFTAV